MKTYTFPWYGYFAILMISISWYFNWTLEGVRTHILFFPLWLGYCLLVDAIVQKRKGHSLMTRSWKRYIGLFILSIPVWWLFEGINLRTQNWQYMGRSLFSDLEYFLFASLCFSTVIPAVFGTAELISTFSRVRNLGRGPLIPASRLGLTVLMVLGIISLIFLFLWPGWFYPFVWLSVFLILDVINHIRGNRSLVYYSNMRNWRPMAALALGCLVCGFFWELWNYYSYPKWIYHTPGVEFLYAFEMPLPGYLGYIPFSFELFAFYHLVTGTPRHSKDQFYVQV